MSEREQESCAGCRFWLSHLGGEYGICRRMPPVIQLGLVDRDVERMYSDRGVFPATSNEDWCGEFRPKQPARQAVTTNGHALRVEGLPMGGADLSVRARKCLRRLGIASLEQLAQCRPDDLLEVKNIGMGTLNEIERFLAKHGLSLKAQ